VNFSLVPNPDGPSADDAASEWLIRQDRASLTVAEESEFHNWLTESPANAEAYDRACAAWGAFDGARSDPDFVALRQEALRAGPAGWRSWRLPAGVAVAASLAAALMLSPGSLNKVTAPDSRPAAAISSRPVAAAQTAASFSTQKGERRTVVLPDGSSVTLNTDTVIEQLFSAGTRLVRMTRGQALFEVAKDHARPFVVEAGGRQVTALGTIFEVRMDPGRVKVLLVRGKVVVDKVDGAPAPVAVKPTILTPGQELVAELGAVQRVSNADVSTELMWKDGYIEFHNENLGEAVAEMNRYSRREIALGDPRLAGMRFSGVFKTGDPERFAALVGELLPVRTKVTSTGDVEIVSASGRQD
jgi:transmembrane sensor